MHYILLQTWSLVANKECKKSGSGNNKKKIKNKLTLVQNALKSKYIFVWLLQLTSTMNQSTVAGILGVGVSQNRSLLKCLVLIS
jgi:hypothetical protein